MTLTEINQRYGRVVTRAAVEAAAEFYREGQYNNGLFWLRIGQKTYEGAYSYGVLVDLQPAGPWSETGK